MKLLFTGDVCFMDQGVVTYEQSQSILQDVMPIFRQADFRIMNLETPLANETDCEKLPKSGPNIICPPENIAFLQAAERVPSLPVTRRIIAKPPSEP